MAKTITFANFKGGVGKTTTSVMTSYVLNKLGKKVLLVDLDPQHSATDIIFKTYGIDTKEYDSIFQGLVAKDLSGCIYEMEENLHLIPSDLDLVGFSRQLYSTTKDLDKLPLFINLLLEDIKENYDYILIDVPPTISDITNNAIVASDYVVLVMQTHEQSFNASLQFVDYLREMQTYNANIDLLGVVPYMIDVRGKVDKEIMVDAKEVFGDVLFKNKIMNRQRIKQFGRTGIKNEDSHDASVIGMYADFVNEFIERIE